MDHTKRVVVVTGAAGNLGGAVARVFKAAGARLALVDRREGRLSELYPEWQADEGVFFVAPVELTQPERVARGVEQICEHFRRIDVLLNVAGAYRGGMPVHETPPAVLEQLLDANLRSAFIMSRAVAPLLLEQGAGKIINVGSRAALEGQARSAAYSLAKAGVLRLTESLAAELRPHGINVNCVLPGTLDTPENRQAMPGADFDKWVAPEAVAEVMLFLASDAARDIHGAALPVFGRS